MRAAALAVFSFLLPCAAQQRTAAPMAAQVRPVPDEAMHQNARLTASLSPSAKRKVQAAAAEVAATAKRQPAITVAQLQSVARASVGRSFPSLAGVDIDAVVFMVMMQCAQDQQSDLQQTMTQMQQNTHAKQAARASAQAGSAAQANAQMSDMSTETQLRLQMQMDRRSKLLRVISNVMKSASDTQSAVVANLK